MRAMIFLAALVLTNGVHAGPLDAAKAADDRGDYGAALGILMRLAEKGNAEAQARLGMMHETGEGVIQDYAAAMAWYLQAAEQGNATAQNNLGMMYARGLGTRKNFVEGHKWVNLAAARKKWLMSNREYLEAKMTPEQIAEAQRLAREWQVKHQGN